MLTTMTTPNRVSWLSELLRAGLETKVLSEADILAHATPAILIASLPREVLATVFDSAMTSGTMSPEELVRTATPDTIAAHVPPRVIWTCFAAAAERAGIPSPKPAADQTASRELLRRVLTVGLTAGVIAPKDIVRHVDAKVLAHALPDALTQKLLEASLSAGKMNADLVVETIGIDGITAHAPVHAVWACVAGAGEPVTGELTSKSGARPALQYVDDEVASVLVDLDDSSVLKPMMVDSKDAPAKPASKNVTPRRPS